MKNKTASNVVQFKPRQAKRFAEFRKMSNHDLINLLDGAKDSVLFYENVDSFNMSYEESDNRKKANELQQDIVDFIQKFRPTLKGNV